MKTFSILLVALCLSATQAEDQDVRVTQIDQCCPDGCNLARQLKATQVKLELIESRLQTSEEQRKATEEKLTSMEEKWTTKLELMESRIHTNEEGLQRLVEGRRQVAFSVALRDNPSNFGNTGPFNTNTAIQYKKIFSNIGNGYNPATGIFTAQIKGMYYLSFSMRNNLSSPPNSIVTLMKNEEGLVMAWDTVGDDGNDSASNAVVIPLDVGDNVYVRLSANRIIYDDGGHYNTFVGFFLFPM